MNEEEISKMLEDMPRDEKVAAFALGIIADLKQRGLVMGPDMLTADGAALFAQLEKVGFCPSAAEMIPVFGYLFKDKAIELAADALSVQQGISKYLS